MKIFNTIFILLLSILFSGCFSLMNDEVKAPEPKKIEMGLKSGNCFKTRHLPYNHKKLYENVKLLLLKSKFKIISSNQDRGMITATGHLIINDNGVEKIVYLMNSIIIKKMDDISYMMIDTSFHTKKFIEKDNHLRDAQISFRYPLKMHKSQMVLETFGSNHYNNFYRMFYLNIYQSMFELNVKYYNDKY
jgi:hypothetical protein